MDNGERDRFWDIASTVILALAITMVCLLVVWLVTLMQHQGG